jgi:heterodisulfide reductase subunit A
MDENQDNSIPKDTLNPKIGVYVCRCGGNISDYIDTEALAATAAQIPGVSVSTVNSFMCSDPGQNLVEQDVKAGKVDRVVVASCSPFLHEITFQAAVKRGGLNPYLYTHVNIREQGSWAHGHQGKDATKLAMLNIAAGIGKVRHVEPLEKIRLPSHRRVLVLGGGVAGMKAAIDVAKRGLPALIVEPADKLGGRTASIPTTYPRGESGADLVAALQKEIDSCDDIVAMTGSKVTGIKGFIGNFDITVTTGDKSENHAVGTIIVATGFDPYQPANGEYGFGHEQVATLPEFMDELGKAKDAAAFTWKGKPVRSIAMIHCVGSRQCEGVQKPQPDGEINDYCSRICCTSLLRTAVEVCERFPETKVYDFHQDIRTYGRGQEDYYIRASELGVTFFRWDGEEPPVVAADGAKLSVTVKDLLTFGEELEVPVDLIVLGVGVMPSKIKDIVEMLKLPVGADRFIQEVHPKLRPVEVAVNGLLLAGTAQGPMSIEESLEGASAAAAKASILLAHDFTELEPFVAKVKTDLCIGCRACIDECVYSGAILEKTAERDGKQVKVAEVNPGLCKGCGACVAVCPTRALDVQGWTLEQFEAMVDGLTSDMELVEA